MRANLLKLAAAIGMAGLIAFNFYLLAGLATKAFEAIARGIYQMYGLG